jgi:hypothetical protein
MLAGGVTVGLLVAARWAAARWRARRRLPVDPEAELDTTVVLEAERLTWRMPPLSELGKPAWSAGRKIGMITLRAYLVIAVSLVIVKVIQLSLGH